MKLLPIIIATMTACGGGDSAQPEPDAAPDADQCVREPGTVTCPVAGCVLTQRYDSTVYCERLYCPGWDAQERCGIPPLGKP